MRVLNKILFIGFMAMFFAIQAKAVLYWGRPFDPNLQRWIQRDPIGEQGGINLYAYVGNNPPNNFDPLGLRIVTPHPWWWDYDPVYRDSLESPHQVGLSEFDGGGGPDSEYFLIGAQNGSFGGFPDSSIWGGAAMAASLSRCNPSILRLPPTRPDGADPFKLAGQIKQFGYSVHGMPPILVTEGANGQMMINDGVTRAIRAAMTPGTEVPIEIYEQNAALNLNNLPTVGSKLPGQQ